jgi:cytidylate kinase
MIITLDGPMASGKSTIGNLLAQRLNAYYLCSGFYFVQLRMYSNSITAIQKSSVPTHGCKIFRPLLIPGGLCISTKIAV